MPARMPASKCLRSAITPDSRCRAPAVCAWWKSRRLPKLQTACTTQVGEGMVGAHRERKGGAGAQEHARAAACQSSARLPGVRRRRRVRTAGHDVQVRRGGIEVHRHQEPSRRAAMVAGRLLRPPALHSVLSLRARLRRGHGRMGAGHSESRPELGHRSQQRRPPRMRRVRHVHRHLPGRRTHLAALTATRRVRGR